MNIQKYISSIRQEVFLSTINDFLKTAHLHTSRIWPAYLTSPTFEGSISLKKLRDKINTFTYRSEGIKDSLELQALSEITTRLLVLESRIYPSSSRRIFDT